MLVLGTLSTFRWIEARLPTETYAIFMVRLAATTRRPSSAARADRVHRLLAHNLSYRLHDLGQFEYRMVLRTLDEQRARAVRQAEADSSVLEFRIAPTGD